MESTIRKEIQDVSLSQSDLGAVEVRRSRRTHQPTSQYLEGMEQLRKGVKVREAPRQSQRSNKRLQLQRDCSESLVQQSEVTSSDEWIICILPGDEPRKLNIQVVLQAPSTKGLQKPENNGGKESQSTCHEESIDDNLPNGAPIKKAKLSSSSNEKHGLLSILYNLAFKVATENNVDCMNEEILMEKPSMLQLSPTLTIPTPRRFQAILEEKKTSNLDDEWRQIPKSQLATDNLKENVLNEKNKNHDSLTTPQCFERKFLKLHERFSECKRKLFVADYE